MKKIMNTSSFFLLFLLIVTGGLPGMGIDNHDSSTYESYLAIKYYLHLYEFKKAETLIDRYLAKHPEDPFILTEKAFLLQHLKNDRQKALELLEKSRSIYPGYHYSNYLQATILFAKYNDAVEAAGGEKKKQSLALLEEAVKYLEISIKDNSRFYDSVFLIAVILSEKGEYKESNGYFERANRLKQTATAYLYMAGNYRQLNDTDGVIASYKKILTFNPSNFGALSALSQIYQEKKDFKSAAAHLEKLFLQFPNNRQVALEYLYSLFAAGESKKFLEVSKKSDISGSPLLVHAKALILSREKKFAEAEKLLETVKKKDFGSYMLLAEIYLQQQEYYRAYQALEGIAGGSKNYLYYSLKAHVLSLLGLNQRITGLFNRVKKDKTIAGKLAVNDYYNILFAYSKLDRLEKALEAALFIKNQLKKEDTEKEKVTELIQVLQNLSTGKEIKAIDIKHETNISLIMTFYKNQHRYGKAVTMIKEIMANEKIKGKTGGKYRDEYLSLELCDIYLEQEQFKKAESLIKDLRKKFPSSDTVKNYYAYFLALQNKKLNHALELSADTLAENEGNPAYLDTYGYILSRLGRFAEAETYLKKAYAKLPFDPEIIEHLVHLYRLQKKNDRVIEIYQKAVDNGVDFKDRLLKKIEELKNAPEQRR